jgi:hypothetical protein
LGGLRPPKHPHFPLNCVTTDSFNLRPERVLELAHGVRQAFNLSKRDLAIFSEFLDELSTADEEREE